MKFKECREFAEAISEALKKLMDDEWDSGRWKKKIKKVTYLSFKRGKAKKLENCVSLRLLSISRKILENINKQKDCKPQQKRCWLSAEIIFSATVSVSGLGECRFGGCDRERE